MGRASFIAPKLCVPIVADATANTTLTSMAAARDFYGGSARYTWRMDLSGFSQIRLVIRRMAAVGAAGAAVGLAYSSVNPAGAFVTGDWTDLVSVNITTQNQVADSGWTNIPQAAQIDNIYLGALMSGGDAVQSPVCGTVLAFFR